METQLNSVTDVSIDYGGEIIDLHAVGFSGTFAEEPPEPANGYPGYREANVLLDNVHGIILDVASWLECVGRDDITVNDNDIIDRVVASIEESVCDNPGRFIG